MSYSNITSKDLKENFGITQLMKPNVFTNISPRQVSEWLKISLQKHTSMALTQGLEKARSEFIIAPILGELRKIMRHEISLFSGVDFTVDAEQGLAGVCDLVQRSHESSELPPDFRRAIHRRGGLVSVTL